MSEKLSQRTADLLDAMEILQNMRTRLTISKDVFTAWVKYAKGDEALGGAIFDYLLKLPGYDGTGAPSIIAPYSQRFEQPPLTNSSKPTPAPDGCEPTKNETLEESLIHFARVRHNFGPYEIEELRELCQKFFAAGWKREAIQEPTGKFFAGRNPKACDHFKARTQFDNCVYCDRTQREHGDELP